MQEITIASISTKAYKKKDGAEGEFVVIKSEDGSEFTSFDQELKSLGKGSKLKIEPEVKKGHTNIKSFEIIEKASAAAPVPGNVPDATAFKGKSPEQFDIERRSTEAQTAFNGVVAMLASKVSIPDDVRDLAFGWVRVRLAGTLGRKLTPTSAHVETKKETVSTNSQPSDPEWDKIKRDETAEGVAEPKPEPATDAPKTKPAPAKVQSQDGGVDLNNLEFKNQGEFYTACLKHFKLDKSHVDKEISEYDISIPKQRSMAWKAILAVYLKKVEN